MAIIIEQVVIWLIIAVVVGCIGELFAGRHTVDGLLGATILGLLSILLLIGVLHFHIEGEPFFSNVPLISTILAAAVLVTVWSGFVYEEES